MKHDFEKSIKCPYCDKECEDYDSKYFDRYDDSEMTCEHCGKKFYCEVYRVVEFNTVGDCRSNNDLPHTLKLSPPHDFLNPKPGNETYNCTKCFREYYGWHLADGQFPRLKEGEYTLPAMPPRTSGDK